MKSKPPKPKKIILINRLIAQSPKQRLKRYLKPENPESRSDPKPTKARQINYNPDLANRTAVYHYNPAVAK